MNGKHLRNKKILLVAFSGSVHTARWVNQFKGSGVSFVIFPSEDLGIVNKKLEGTTIYHTFFGKHRNWNESDNRNIGINVRFERLAAILREFISHKFPNYRINQLLRVIDKEKPDLIHSLEIQHGGYLVDEAHKRMKGKFPKWLVTNWGSDIYLFGQLPEERDRIRSVLSHCNYYSCECERDVKLARDFGFKGEVMPVFPNAGGLDLKLVRKLRSNGDISKRKIVSLKGYQNWSGRSLSGLRALERCVDLLSGYQIAIYSCDPGVGIAAELFTEKTGIPSFMLPPGTPHDEVLRLHGKSRISIGLSISDGVSTSFLEALAMGSFPIQSNTACADEWIECGKTGYIVPPEDPEEIEKKIRIALTDDKLVDTAAKINWETTKKRLDGTKLAAQAKEMYQEIVNEIKI